MQDTGLTKLAAAAIRQLQTENEELKDKLDKQEEAIKLAFDLFHQGIIASEQLENKIKEFSTKSIDEIGIIKKASEFTKTAASMSSFKLSSSVSFDSNITAEDRFIASLMEDI